MERHAFEPVSFFFGAIFVAAGLMLLTGDTEAIPLDWAGPTVAVCLGLLIVLAVRPRRSGGEPSDEPEPDKGA